MLFSIKYHVKLGKYTDKNNFLKEKMDGIKMWEVVGKLRCNKLKAVEGDPAEGAQHIFQGEIDTG